MQSLTEEQLSHHFEMLEKLLREPRYTTLESKEILLKLLADPNIELSVETFKEYGILKSFLLNPNPSVRQLTQLAISLAVLSLSKEGKIIADNIRRTRRTTGSQNFWLDLSVIKFPKLAAADWQAFAKALASSKLTLLYLGSNLSSLEAADWQAFGKALASSKLTSLSLGNNNLSSLEAAGWQALCDVLAFSKLTSLYLGYNNLFRLGAADWQGLIRALKDNFHLQIEGLDGQPPQLDVLIKRNRLLKDACTKAIEVIDLKSELTEKEFLARIEDAFRLLSQGLSLVQGITTPNADKMRKQLQSYIDELNYKKGCYLREHLVHDQDVDPMLSAWITISAQSPRCEEGHMQAFQFVYASTYRLGAPPAFMEALPYLLIELNERGELIKLDENHQIIFDGYLFAAAGGKKQFEKRKLSPEERLSLLQYVLLMDIKKQCESSASAITQFFTQERQAGLGNLLEKNLPAIDPGHLDPDVEKKIADLWQEVSNRLDKVPLEENKKAVVTAIQSLALEAAQTIPKIVK